jgi:hypothetical protein
MRRFSTELRSNPASLSMRERHVATAVFEPPMSRGYTCTEGRDGSRPLLRLGMNWRRGLFRFWAALSMLWVAIVGCALYPDALHEYWLTKTRNTYDLTLPDGRAIKIISSTDAGAAVLAEVEKKFGKDPLVAPNCKDGAGSCQPWERQWEGSGLVLLPGATINEVGLIVGPYSIIDDKSYGEARASLATALKIAALGSVLPPVALGLSMLAVAWIVRGFSSA